MSKNKEQMQAEFEVIARSYEWSLAKDEKGDYLNGEVYAAWLLYKAATASKQREIDALNEKIERMSRLATPSDFVREENKALKREIDELNKTLEAKHYYNGGIGFRQLKEIERLEAENALYSADAKRCWEMMPELAEDEADYELHEAVNHILQQRDALNQQVLELSAMVEKMRESLEPFAENIPEDYKAPCHNGLTTARKCGRCGRAHRAYEALSLSPSTALRDYVNEEVAKAQQTADLLQDSAYVAGMKFGWNCCVENNYAAYNSAIESRIRERRNRK